MDYCWATSKRSLKCWLQNYLPWGIALFQRAQPIYLDSALGRVWLHRLATILGRRKSKIFTVCKSALISILNGTINSTTNEFCSFLCDAMRCSMRIGRSRFWRWKKCWSKIGRTKCPMHSYGCRWFRNTRKKLPPRLAYGQLWRIAGCGEVNYSLALTNLQLCITDLMDFCFCTFDMHTEIAPGFMAQTIPEWQSWPLSKVLQCRI